MEPLKYSNITSTYSSQIRFSPTSSATKFRKQGTIALETITKIEQKINPVKPKEERDAKIRERYANMETVAAIAKDYGICPSAVYYICMGVERKIKPKRDRKKRQTPINPEMKKRNEEIRKRFANGETLAAIGKDFGLTSQSISLICKGVERNIKPIRTRKKDPQIEARNERIKQEFVERKTAKDIAKKERDQAIKEKFANGQTQKTIAKEYAISRMTVSRICRAIERTAKYKQQKKWNPKEKEIRNQIIKQRYVDGELQNEIAKDYGLTPQAISVICKKVERKLKPKEIRNQQIRERYANMETAKEIAKDLGLNQFTVIQICIGVKRKARHKKEFRNQKIREERATGQTLAQISEEWGISQSRVSRICNRKENE